MPSAARADGTTRTSLAAVCTTSPVGTTVSTGAHVEGGFEMATRRQLSGR